ncbi:MAG: small subunit ribosomal protein S11 [Parcubacteria group bacterium Greene0416_39]|nr:MAG: small subunit ribosomal protein S11 [Parcubacteria group bacterium Greene0416_39]TSC97728.1 MAG: small subunit ribosomal protein S11 [Parcubacteria group bacterium Greene1014_47]
MGKKRVAQKQGEEIKTTPSAPEAPVQKGSKEGRVYVYSSYNNTIISLTDPKGNVLASLSAGRMGFKGTRKSTPFAASKVADAIFQLAETKGISKVEIFIKGVGAGRDSALRSLGGKTFEIMGIRDITPVPHNGPRPPKVRRV